MSQILKDNILDILSKDISGKSGGLKSSTSDEPQTFFGGLKSSTSDEPQTFFGGKPEFSPPAPLKNENSEIVGAYPQANNGLTSGGAKGRDRPPHANVVDNIIYLRSQRLIDAYEKKRLKELGNPINIYGNKYGKAKGKKLPLDRQTPMTFGEVLYEEKAYDPSKRSDIWYGTERAKDETRRYDDYFKNVIRLEAQKGLILSYENRPKKATASYDWYRPRKDWAGVSAEDLKKADVGKLIAQKPRLQRIGALGGVKDYVISPTNQSTIQKDIFDKSKGILTKSEKKQMVKDHMKKWEVSNPNEKDIRRQTPDAFGKDAKGNFTIEGEAKFNVWKEKRSKWRDKKEEEEKRFQKTLSKSKSAPKAKAQSAQSAPAQSAPAKKSAKGKRAPSAYNIFVKEFSKTYSGDPKNRMKKAGEAWGKLPASGKAKAPAKAPAKKPAKKLKKKLVLVDEKAKIEKQLEKNEDSFNKKINLTSNYSDATYEKEFNKWSKTKKKLEKKLVLVDSLPARKNIKLTTFQPKKAKAKKGKKLKIVDSLEAERAPTPYLPDDDSEDDDDKPKTKCFTRENKEGDKYITCVDPNGKQLRKGGAKPKELNAKTNRSRHKKKFTRPPSKYNLFVKEYAKAHKGDQNVLSNAAKAWRAQKGTKENVKIANPAEPASAESAEPAEPITSIEDLSTRIPKGTKAEKIAQKKRHNLKLNDTIEDELPSNEENSILADILDSFDNINKEYETTFNSPMMGSEKFEEYNRIAERADDYEIRAMKLVKGFSLQTRNRVERAYRHVRKTEKVTRPSITSGVPQKIGEFKNFEEEDRDASLIEASLAVEPSIQTLDDAQFGVAFAETIDDYEWDAGAVPPLREGEVSMQNYPQQVIYEAPPAFRDTYNPIYQQSNEYSDFTSSVFPKKEMSDIKADIDDAVFKRYMMVMRKFNPYSSENHIKWMFAKNKKYVYEMILDLLESDKKGGYYGGEMADPRLYTEAFEKLFGGGMCGDEKRCGGGIIISNLSKKNPKTIFTELVKKLFIKEAVRRNKMNMSEILKFYEENKKRIQNELFDLVHSTMEKSGGASNPIGANQNCGANQYRSGNRCYTKQRKEDVITDRATYDLEQQTLRRPINRTVGSAPRRQENNREASSEINKEKSRVWTTTPDKGKTLTGRDNLYGTDESDLSDPKAWADSLYNIASTTYDVLKEIWDFF